MGALKSKKKKSDRGSNDQRSFNGPNSNQNVPPPYSNFNSGQNFGQNNGPGLNNPNNFNSNNMNNPNYNNQNNIPNNSNFNNQNNNSNSNNANSNSDGRMQSSSQNQNQKNANDKVNSQPQCNQPIVCVIVVDSLRGKELSEFIPSSNKKSKPIIEELDEDDIRILKAIKNRKSSPDCFTKTTVFNELICE